MGIIRDILVTSILAIALAGVIFGGALIACALMIRDAVKKINVDKSL